jgi:hypothetical protein
MLQNNLQIYCSLLIGIHQSIAVMSLNCPEKLMCPNQKLSVPSALRENLMVQKLC